MGNNNLGKVLFDSVENDSIIDLSIDIGDLTLDMLTENEGIKSIPIVGLLVKSFNAVSTVRDFLFAKKILLFLKNTNDVSLDERIKFVKKIDSREKAKIGEQILLLLDRHETIEKSKMLAQIFKSHIEGKISKIDFDRISYSIDRLFLPDLERLIKFTSQDYSPQEELQRLYFSGLIVINYKDRNRSFNFDFSVADYSLSDIGKKFLDILYPDRLKHIQDNLNKFI